MNYSKSPLFSPMGMGAQPMRGRSCPQPRDKDCENPSLSGYSLAMVYCPVQEFDHLYEPEAGLCAGTIFHELEKPFWGAGRMQ